jgi:aspartate/methionine/tyrosine aminotransferase
LSQEEIDTVLDLSLSYGWTNGMPSARQAVARLYPNRTENEVLFTNGSAEANFVLLWSLFEPEDELVLMLPNYMQMWGIARSFGVNVKPFYLREENRWQPDLDELRKLVSPKTKMISICHPHNPTGATFSREILQGMAQIAGSVNAYFHADEIYRGSELNGHDVTSVAELGYGKAIVTCGLSKAMAMPGLRIGWLLGPADLVAQAWHHNDYTSITTCIVSEKVTEWILEPQRRKKILDRGRVILRENLATMQQWLSKYQGQFRFVPPTAGGMAFIGYSLKINSTELTEYIRENKSVFIVPGDCYGMDGYIRIGIGTESEVLAEGLRLTSEALDELAKGR